MTGSIHHMRKVSAASPRTVELEVFRIAVGLTLVVHFADHYSILPKLSNFAPFLTDLTTAALIDSRPALDLFALPTTGIKLAVGLAVVLAASIAVGIGARLCASVLFIISLSVHEAIFPLSHIDDLISNYILFWLILLPVGHALRPSSLRHGTRVESHKDISSSAVHIFVSLTLVAYFCAPFALKFAPNVAHPQELYLLFPLIPALYVAPGRASKIAGLTMQVALHIVVAAQDGLIMTHGAFMATAPLIWRPLSAEQTATSSNVLDTAGAVGLVQLVILGLYAAGTIAGVPSLKMSTRYVLGSIGLTPVASGQRPVAEGAKVVTVLPSGEQAYAFSLSHRRERMWAAYLRDGRKATGTSSVVALSFAETFCNDHARPDSVASLRLTSPNFNRKVFRFACGASGSRPKILNKRRVAR